MKNLGFLLDLVVILLIGNKITYINEHIKFKHFKEHDGPTFFATWLGKRKLWCFYCKKLGYVICTTKRKLKKHIVVKRDLKINKINTKRNCNIFLLLFPKPKIYNYCLIDTSVIKHIIFHPRYFKSHVQKVFENNLCILLTIQIINIG